MHGKPHYLRNYYWPPDQLFAELSALRDPLGNVCKLHPADNPRMWTGLLLVTEMAGSCATPRV